MSKTEFYGISDQASRTCCVITYNVSPWNAQPVARLR